MGLVVLLHLPSAGGCDIGHDIACGFGGFVDLCGGESEGSGSQEERASELHGC